MPDLPTSEELEASLCGLLDRWFPACIDLGGGYYQNFDAAFRPTGDATKDLVFQSRMVWFCATVAPLREEFADYARHGLRFILERMRLDDAFSWSIDANGSTTEEIHAYGLSFALYGFAAIVRHMGDIDAHEAADRIADYLERVHRDPVNGGYFEASVGGKPKLQGEGGDTIGTSYGQKSQNTHLHLMEAYAELSRARPGSSVGRQLEETIDILTNRLFVATPHGGHLTLFTHADWTPASTDVSYGHDIEAAHLLLDAEDELQSLRLFLSKHYRIKEREESPVLGRARALADHTLAKGWDAEHGGVFNLGDAEGPTDRSKVWWVQAEALLGFATLWKRTGEACYADALARTWEFIRDRQIDPEHGGWYEEAGRPERPKGHAWKAAYHDGRALLFTARLLRGDSLA